MRRLNVVMAVVSVAVLIGAGSVTAGQPASERVWANDQEYEFLGAQFPFHGKASENSHEPLYLIAPVNEGNPQDPGRPEIALGAHDHAIQVPPGNGGTYSAVWRVSLVLANVGERDIELCSQDPSMCKTDKVAFRMVNAPTPLGPALLPFAYAADLGQGFVNLTSVDKVASAADKGLVFLVDTGTALVATVVKVGQGQ